MSGFLSRWARRKAAVRDAAAEPAIEPVDLASLPPIDALDAASDFAAFLRQGVPAALQTRALRVAWESDTAISGFRGMAEYDWDFNAEGYGRLSATDDVAALLRRIVSPDPPMTEPAPDRDVALQSPAESFPETPFSGSLDPDHPETMQAEANCPSRGGEVTPESTDAPRLRRHGGALPT